MQLANKKQVFFNGRGFQNATPDPKSIIEKIVIIFGQ